MELRGGESPFKKSLFVFIFKCNIKLNIFSPPRSFDFTASVVFTAAADPRHDVELVMKDGSRLFAGKQVNISTARTYYGCHDITNIMLIDTVLVPYNFIIILCV